MSSGVRGRASRFSKLVGATGKVYAVDIYEMAIKVVKREIAGRGWQNVAPVLASGYNSGVPDAPAGHLHPPQVRC
jgi:ubiquinone/menaquinone biosynthesis C-methylase UbiE